MWTDGSYVRMGGIGYALGDDEDDDDDDGTPASGNMVDNLDRPGAWNSTPAQRAAATQGSGLPAEQGGGGTTPGGGGGGTVPGTMPGSQVKAASTGVSSALPWILGGAVVLGAVMLLGHKKTPAHHR